MRGALRPLLRGAALVHPRPAGGRRRTTRARGGLSLGYAGVQLRQGEFRDRIEWCDRAGGGGRARPPTCPRSRTPTTSATSPHSLRGPERAIPWSCAADLRGARRSPRPGHVLNNLGIDAYYEGRWDEALDLYERSRAARERIGDVVGAAPIANNIGEMKSYQRPYHRHRAVHQAREVFETSGHRMLATLALRNLGRAGGPLKAGSTMRSPTWPEPSTRSPRSAPPASSWKTKARLAELAVLARTWLPPSGRRTRPWPRSRRRGAVRSCMRSCTGYARTR